MEMTNEQKAKRLEEISACPLCMESGDTPLLRESAALWRERDGVRWVHNRWPDDYLAFYAEQLLAVRRIGASWEWRVTWGGLLRGSGASDTLDAAKQAAIAWVDAQEGE
jgi:hypothetical protein